MSEARIDMPTNEGTLSLVRCIATGAKLIVSGAVLLDSSVYDKKVQGDPEKAALVTWGEPKQGSADIDISDCALEGMSPIPCTSYLPIEVSNIPDGVDALSALDIEFTWMPSSTVTYRGVSVLANMYYAFSQFYTGRNYVVGDTVWMQDTSGVYSYYRCYEPISSASESPSVDTDHWESVDIDTDIPDIVTPRGVQYRALKEDRPTVLYLSVAQNDITVSHGMEIDYKVRLYINSEASEISRYIVFDTLGPEFMGSAQLALLASFAQQLRHIRDVAVEKVSRG